MKTLGFVFSYNRAATLRACLQSLASSKVHLDSISVIDDRSTETEVGKVLDEFDGKENIFAFRKHANLGFSDSALLAFGTAHNVNPDYLFLIEGDYVFRKYGIGDVLDCFQNTEEGRNCLGIVGYDHPNFRNAYHTDHGFSACMKAQVGEDNVNRAALHIPRVTGRGYAIELVSNTCYSCYLNWKKLREIATEFSELDDLLQLACAPQELANYPDSAKYKAQRTVDDGMLSHAISLVWNRWAMKHGIDRGKNAAWLNIRPSVAEHRFQGGTNFS